MTAAGFQGDIYFFTPVVINQLANVTQSCTHLEPFEVRVVDWLGALITTEQLTVTISVIPVSSVSAAFGNKLTYGAEATTQGGVATFSTFEVCSTEGTVQLQFDSEGFSYQHPESLAIVSRPPDCADHTLPDGTMYKDGAGRSCAVMQHSELCASRGELDPKQGLTAADACCTCGGGYYAPPTVHPTSMITEVPTTASPTVLPEPHYTVHSFSRQCTLSPLSVDYFDQTKDSGKRCRLAFRQAIGSVAAVNISWQQAVQILNVTGGTGEQSRRTGSTVSIGYRVVVNSAEEIDSVHATMTSVMQSTNVTGFAHMFVDLAAQYGLELPALTVVSDSTIVQEECTDDGICREYVPSEINEGGADPVLVLVLSICLVLVCVCAFVAAALVVRHRRRGKIPDGEVIEMEMRYNPSHRGILPRPTEWTAVSSHGVSDVVQCGSVPAIPLALNSAPSSVPVGVAVSAFATPPAYYEGGNAANNTAANETAIPYNPQRLFCDGIATMGGVIKEDSSDNNFYLPGQAIPDKSEETQ